LKKWSSEKSQCSTNRESHRSQERGLLQNLKMMENRKKNRKTSWRQRGRRNSKKSKMKMLNWKFNRLELKRSRRKRKKSWGKKRDRLCPRKRTEGPAGKISIEGSIGRRIGGGGGGWLLDSREMESLYLTLPHVLKPGAKNEEKNQKEKEGSLVGKKGSKEGRGLIPEKAKSITCGRKYWQRSW